MSGRKLEILKREAAFQGYFRVHRLTFRHTLHGGGWSRALTREVFDRGHAVAVLPYDPAADAVVLIEQVRAGALDDARGAWLVETVAGVIDAGETPEDVARREAREEAGCTVRDLALVGDMLVSPGAVSERIVVYVGHTDSASLGGIHGLPEEGEDIRVMVTPFAEAMAMIADGRLYVAHTVIALQWLALNRERLRRAWQAG